MKVSDLIAKLACFPPDAEVNVDDGDLWPLKDARQSDPPGIVILEYMVRDEPIADDGRRFIIDGENGDRYTLAEMLEANQDDTGICSWLQRAAVGESFQVGGGAAAEFKLERVA
jgi:hypothetical protein